MPAFDLHSKIISENKYLMVCKRGFYPFQLANFNKNHAAVK